MTPVERADLAEDLAKRMEAHIREVVTDIVEDVLAAVLMHIGNEMVNFSRMRSHDRHPAAKAAERRASAQVARDDHK